MSEDVFHPLVPGARLDGDWFDSRVPENIEVGEGTVIDSTFCFKHYFATGPLGLRVGRNVTIWRTSLAAGQNGLIEIGDCCYLANASLVCASRITIGSYVMIAGGVTIVDSDFHPTGAAARLADSVALSSVGDRRRRPAVETRPVTIGDDVWIGYNAAILKGVQVGAGAVIEPGAVVVRDVPSGAVVSGNPAQIRAIRE
ncbi:MAG: acyltransferase [Gemmatimonadaceae bacterium]